MARLLVATDPPPVGRLDAGSASPFVVICDHAGNAVPRRLGDLGLPRSELERHIGIDIGALPVAQGLAARLEAPLVFQRYSRLVVDCNRRLTAPDSMAVVADGTAIPANRDLAPAARAARAEEIMAPYHASISELLDRRVTVGQPTILVSVHSFTPQLRAKPAPRPWHVALCWGPDDRFSRRVLARLEAPGDLRCGANEPYSVEMEADYSIPVHGEGRGLPYVELEVRQDLLADAQAAAGWALRLAGALRDALTDFRP
jgi:predicted N-formylglutamate amidohydrolase